MAAFPHHCPHCDTRRASFEVVAEFRAPDDPKVLNGLVRCGVCGGAAVAVFYALGKTMAPTNYQLIANMQSHPGDIGLHAFYPEPETPAAPDHLPTNIREFYLEAAANVKSGPNAAGAMFRKSVDVALKAIDPEGKGTLVKRIDAAAKRGLLTSSLAEWAHRVRLEGNDASHDEDPFTPEEAEILHRFTELVLLYLFTLPGMLEEWRAGDEDGMEVEAEAE